MAQLREERVTGRVFGRPARIAAPTTKGIFLSYLFGVALVGLGVLIRFSLSPYVGPSALPYGALYFAVIVAAAIKGWQVGLFTLLLSIVAVNLFFLPDAHTKITPLPGWVGTAVFVLNLSVVIILCERLLRAQRLSQKQAVEIQDVNDNLESLVEQRTDELKKSNGELEAANRDLSTFAYSVSHDLRSPLRGISMTSAMLRQDLADTLSEEHLENLRSQETNAKRLSTLIDDLLNLSRVNQKELTRESFDLTEEARHLARELMHGSNSKATIHVEPGLSAFGDRQFVRIIVQNLLENSLKFSPNGGQITVGQTVKDGKEAFFVRDEGIGFNMEFSNKLFVPFARLVKDSDYQGTGIGLANVHRIIERHGGEIWAESEEGKGACFYFTLE